MTNLSLPQNPKPMRITNQAAKARSSEPPPARRLPPDLARKLEAILNTGDFTREEADAMAEMLLRMAAERGDHPTQPPKAIPASDRVSVGGDIEPGANVGPGAVTNNGGVAGRNHVTLGVGSANYNIEHVENLVVPPANAGRTLPPLPQGELMGAELFPLKENEREYLNRLLVTASRVPLGQLDFDSASGDFPEIKLDAIYIPLDTTTTEPAIGGRSDERVHVSALRHVIEHHRVVILGDPGSGKSTFLNFLTWCLAGARLSPRPGALDRLNVENAEGRRAARWRHEALLPVRVDLREFALDIPDDAHKSSRKGTASMLWKHIVRQLDEHHLGDFARDMQSMLNEGKALVMLDGLDEVVDRSKRQIVRQAIDDFADSHSRSRFIVTCRILSYTDTTWKLTSFPDVTLAPLSRAGIGVFVEGWYNTLTRLGYMEPRWNKTRAEELRRAACGSMYDLAQNPMLLTVMAVVHTYKGTLPRERARLYSDCVELLLWNWQRSKQIGPGQWEPGILDELDTREERVMNALCEVAFNAHRAQGNRRDAASIPQKELLDTLQKYLDGDWGKAQKFCEYVEKRAGLLIGKGEGPGGLMYAFPHRGFQEFLAGRHLVSGRSFERNAAALAIEGDIWHEALLLAAGHLVYNVQDVLRPLDAANLLCRDVLPTSLAGWRGVWWAAEILLIVGRPAAEQDEYVGQQLVPRVIAHLTALLEGGWLAPAERAQAGDALGCLGDPRPGVCTPLPSMAGIEGGAFSMGDEEARHTIRIAPFMLSRYPVTNAQFRRFIEADYLNNAFWTPQGIEWRDKAGQHQGLVYDPQWGIDNRPAVGLTWHEALAYTRWLAKRTGKPFRLPTEAEWERAAAGAEGRKFPWGSRASDETANTREAGIGQTTAVGIFTADKTPEGICDLGGNAWEWTSSLDREYPYKADDGRETLSAAGQRILRGGAYDTPRRLAHCAQRRPAEPSTRAALIGFRVAMDAEGK